jgi:outer membrane protein insertion porin family
MQRSRGRYLHRFATFSTPAGVKLGGLVLLERHRQLGLPWLMGWLWPVFSTALLSSSIALADPPAGASPTVPPPAATQPLDTVIAPDLIGRTVDEVRVSGNAQVSSQVILNLVRTREHEKFDPATVEEDYQRIYTLKRFSNVEAKVEPTATGVIVIFDVAEEKLIKSIRFVNNRSVSSEDLQKDIDLKVGEAIEPFRIALAKRAITAALRNKNHPTAHVEVNMDDLTRTGDLVFTIIEGPPVTVRNINFVGGNSFTFGKLNDQVKTTRWYWIFNAGTYDPDQVEEDVAALQHFYRGEGFFDVKVGRKLIFSPDQTEVQIDFLISEGVRYKVDRVSFVGNVNVSDAQLRTNLKMVEGKFFDGDAVQHDVKEIVKDYSPLGYIYDPQSNDPNYLRIGKPSYEFVARTVFHVERGTLDLVYEISEGKPFRTGTLNVKGNALTQQKVVLRELHVQPGQLYNSGELQDAVDRLRSLPNFSSVTITPIASGTNQPDTRDVLVDVKEQSTAKVGFGGQVNSNYGLGGNISYEQKNFDATNVPARLDDFLNNRAFVGAGQTFSATFQPGVDVTNADVSFTEPYIFDQPYSNTDQAYYKEYQRENWYERYAGGEIGLGKQIDYNWSTSVTFQAEDVKVGGIDNYYPLQDRVDVIDPITKEPAIDPHTGRVVTQLRSPRAPEIIADNGHNTITNIGWQIRRDTTNRGPLTYTGSKTSFGYQAYGAMGGKFDFSKFTLAYDDYLTVGTDLLDRKTVLNLHVDSGYITPDAPFFERFYGGGRGSLRGFEFRGVSPRAGRALDPIGGDFELLGTAELNFPLYGDNFRGVVFTDIGTVEPDIRIHTIRQSVGAGVRVVLPFLGTQAPLAFDVGFPVLKGDQDTRQVFSFGIGF